MRFRKFSENFLTSSWWVCNKALINQLFVPYRKFSDLSLMYGPHFIRLVRQSCGLNILPCGQLVNKSIKLKDLSTVEQHLVVNPDCVTVLLRDPTFRANCYSNSNSLVMQISISVN